MVCASCGAENQAGRKFCGQCGGRLSLVCGACGSANPSTDRFCGECGSPIGDSSAALPPLEARSPTQVSAGPATERRLVSVLFADLVGFTKLSESRDPEEVRELLSRYFDMAREIVELYGGTVEKFIGDAVMAVWGTPVANEDDAERAVRTALDLVDAVEALNADVGAENLRARAGVLTGEAAVNLGATGQGMVAGDLVNTASRIQSAAEPGWVLVGDATRRATEAAIVYVDAGSHALKGKDEPLQLYRALRVVAKRGGVGRPEGLEPPFVGREEELRLVKDLLHATTRERRARLVSITGVPGIGKSRLSWEFLKYVDGLAEDVYWHQGRSPAYGEGITFWALGEMVRMRAGITETEDASPARAKLAATVAEFVPDPEERRWIEPRLAHLLALADAPPGKREEMFSAWRTFFERIAERGPLVMVFEDLQWADPGGIDFIESILEWSRAYPILVITLARPELTERRPTWGAGQRSFTSLHLEPLREEAMRELLSGFVRGLPEEVADRVLARAEGVPLYAVETVRMLADRGVLVSRGGSYEVTGELADIEVPETLHALIASRLDALPREERSILSDASVLGKTFTVTGLAAVTGMDQAALEERLRRLVRKEILSLDTDPRSPERGQYGFVQGLIREVAYSTLAKKDRRSKHLATAYHFESLGDEELAGVVAAHYVEAYRSSPEGPEAEAIAARARDSLSQAGERALSLGSPEQALAHFEQALDVTSEGPERASLLERAGEAADRASAYERAVSYLEEAVAYHEGAGEASAAGTATARLAKVLGLDLRRFSEAVGRAEHALAALGEEGSAPVRADLASTLALAHGNSGSPKQALEWSEAALALAERLDDTELLAQALVSKAGALFNLGRHREAAILARGQVALAEAAGSLLEQAAGLLHVSVMVLDEDPREALAASLEAAEVSRRAGHRGLETQNLLNAAEDAIWLGEWSEARAALTELGQRELPGDQSEFLTICEAMLTALTGDPARASEHLAAMAKDLEATEFVSARTTYLRARALVSLVAGDLEAAHRDADAAVTADPSGINSPGALAIQARSSLWLRDAERAKAALAGTAGFRGRWMAAVRQGIEAGLAALEGRTEEARAAYARATEALRALDVALDLALCELDMAILFGPTGVDAVAVSEAREILSRLGAEPFLERLAVATAVGAPAEP